jgi:beta-mannosidase
MRAVAPGAARRIDGGWKMALTKPGAYAGPQDHARLTGWIDAQCPGTAAGALRRAGLFEIASPTRLHDKDVVFSTQISGDGAHVLVFEGLATLCEVWLDETQILIGDSMFHRHEVAVALSGEHCLTMAFRALSKAFSARGPRARWRTQITPNQGARLVRTTLLGQMPGWHPPVEAVGPWRPIHSLRADAHRAENLRINAALVGDDGVLEVSARIVGARAATLCCGDYRAPMQVEADGSVSGALTMPKVRPWAPHTHGAPNLYDLAIEADGVALSLGQTGFRAIEIERGADGRDFALRVNGDKVFCRGAVWTNADLIELPGDAETYERWLRLARDAGMNMVRVSGVMTYESRAFFETCDRLGLMVWSDFMFANFDYPLEDPAFAASCRREAEDFLTETQGCPSLAVICGGSEIRQQAVMMGLPFASVRLPLTEQLLAETAASLRPDAAYVENSPSGGALPFSTSQGVTHYYGVGAYQRPLQDARRAQVRFAAECLAFAHVPQQETLDTHLPGVPPHHPRWKAAVARDNAASWDFEDTREFYLRDLFGVDPAQLRREDWARWLDLSRAVSVEVLETIFAEWRRVGSSCHGALVWTFQDLIPGAGWGVIDSTGHPKPAWYGLKRAFRPRQIVFSDEGADGLQLHVINETAQALSARVELVLLKEGRQPVIRRETALALAPRSEHALWAAEMIGAFFDTAYAFRFGPSGHDTAWARLIDAATGDVLAEAFHFPLGRALAVAPVEFTGRLSRDERGWSVDLETPAVLRFVHIDCPGFAPEDDWLHLAPGGAGKIRLAGQSGKPEVEVSALNSSFRLRLSA